MGTLICKIQSGHWFYCFAVITFFKKNLALNLKKNKFPSITQVSFVSSLGRICPEVLEKILKFVNAFLLFCNYFPFDKGFGPTYKRNWIRCFVPSLVENVPVFQKDFKKISIMYFYYFAIIFTLRREWSFIWKKT